MRRDFTSKAVSSRFHFCKSANSN